MVDKWYVFINIAFIVIGTVMAIFFLTFPIPHEKELKNYRISLNVLAIAYFALAFLKTVVLIFNLNDKSKEPITFIALMISSSQALLFTFTLITLLHPRFISKRYILWQILPIGIISLLFAISASIFGNPFITSFDSIIQNLSHPTLLVRLLFFHFYVFQLIYYSILFFKEEKQYRNQMLNYFSEEAPLKLSWVRYAFFAALFIGSISLVTYFFRNLIFDNIFTSIYSIFYLIFAIQYIRYTNIYIAVKPINTTKPLPEPSIKPEKKRQISHQTLPVKTIPNNNWDYYKNIIVDKKYYLHEKINIEELSQWLKIGRTTLSNYINNEENKNFNTFINTLRIEEAKQLIALDPGISLLQISKQSGFSDQANFSRQFKLYTGFSPSVWKQNSR